MLSQAETEKVNLQTSIGMTNNDVLRKIRYTFDYTDEQMIALFKEGDIDVSRSVVSDWLKRDSDEDYEEMTDKQLAHFLNGFIIEKRGRQEGSAPVAEKSMTNNVILRKIKIALKLKDDDILAILEKAGIRVSKHEISAFFRKPGQRQYRKCLNQFLRNFLMGMQLTYRG